MKRACPRALTVYGGVHPTYHAAATLKESAAVDVVAKGEGEQVALGLVDALSRGGPLTAVAGVAFRGATAPPPPIRELDAWRIGWELIEDWDLYRCFGLGRATRETATEPPRALPARHAKTLDA